MNVPVVHIVDDDEDTRVGLGRLLRAEGYEVRPYESAGHFLLAPAGEGPGCVILDLQMPGPSGLELQEAMAKRGDSLPVVFLSGHGSIRHSVHAIQRGAVDFLTKPVDPDELLKAVEKALARQKETVAAERDQSELGARYARLTPREREILDHLVAGRLNKRIAGLLGASERTIKRDRARLMAKLQVSSLAELVLAAGRLRKRSAKP
jgi:FixJ family two-component response regulator